MKTFVRKILQRFGYDIVKYNPPYTAGALLKEDILKEYRWLTAYNFHTILDIGANEGQFADKMRILFPKAVIYAFEPLPVAYELLCKNFAEDKLLKPINLALGHEEGEVSFNQNEYSPSSSLLPLSEKHKTDFDYAVKTKSVTVKVDTLSHFFQSELIVTPLLVKIDVQGFEDKVIAGGAEILKQASVILCEVSFTELYKGQPLFEQINTIFNRVGFVYAGCTEQLRSPDNNLVLQADAIFIKKEL